MEMIRITASAAWMKIALKKEDPSRKYTWTLMADPRIEMRKRIFRRDGFHFQTDLEGFAGILASEHVVCLGFGYVQVADIPGSIVGQLIIRR